MGLIHLWSESFITDMAQKSQTLHTHKTDLWMSHITDMTHLFVSMSHYAYMNEATRRIHICDMTHAFTYVTWRTHSHMWHDARIHICFKTDSYKWWHHPMTHSSVWCDDSSQTWQMNESWGDVHLCDVTHSSQTWHRQHTRCTHTRLIHLCAMSHYTCMNEATRRIHICDMTQLHMWHGAFTYVTWRSYICDMTHSHMWHDAVTYVTWRIHIRDMTQLHMWHHAFAYVTWRIRIGYVTHSFVCHDSSTYAHSTYMNDATWCIYIWDQTYHMGPDLSTYGTRLIYIWDQTYLRIRVRRHYVFTYMNEATLRIHVYEWGGITYSRVWMRRHR